MSEETIVRRASGAKRIRPAVDWSKVDSRTDSDIAAAVAIDLDAAPLLDADWFTTAEIVEPDTKEKISIRLDRDVLEFFRKGDRYQSRINAVLKTYVEAQKRRKA